MNIRVSCLCFILIGCVVAAAPPLSQIANQFKRDTFSPLIRKGLGANPDAYTPCQIDLAAVINGTFNNSEELLLYSGLNFFELGLYDECQDLENGHYCLLTYNLPEGQSTFPVNTGLCLPLNCSNSDMTSLFQTILKEFNYTLNFTVNCASKNFEKPNASAIVVFTVISILITLCIIGGILEYWLSVTKKKNKSEDEGPLLKAEKGHAINDVEVSEQRLPIYTKILLAFSPITNFKKLLVPTSVPHLASLNGLRTLSMFWVIMGHSAYWGTFTTGYDNPIHVRYVLLQKWISQIMLNAPYSVDAFFYMSGFLVAYLSAKELYNRKKLNLGLYYFHRFWRLTPPYFLALAILWKCMPYLGKGPFWYQVDSYVSRTACDTHWWANLLYINNFIPRDYDVTCMGWSWYLANDMQLYIITPIFIFAYYKFKLLGWALLLIFSCASLAANLGLSLVDNFTPYVPAQQIDDAYLSVVYSKFYTRGIAWLIGIGAGWILFEYEKLPEERKKIPKIVVIIGYILAGFLLAAPIFGTQDLYEKQGNWNKTERMFYLTFGRFSFTVGLAIMMHFLYTGYGLFINSFLSFGLWDILARLTYSAYLYHPILIGIAYFNSTQYFHYSIIEVALKFIAFLVLAFFVSMMSFLLVERPMMNLEKVLLPGHGEKRPAKSNGHSNK